MATLVICDMCNKQIFKSSDEVVYSITSTSSNPQRIIHPSSYDPLHPVFNFEVCETCAKKIHTYISTYKSWERS